MLKEGFSLDMHTVYSLQNRNFSDAVLALDTPLVRQLSLLALQSGKEGKIVSFIMRDRVSNRGEVKERGIPASEKSVVDICKLTPLVGGNGASTLLEEIALYRANTIDFKPSKGDLRSYAELLMADYLMSTALCYVEIAKQGQIRDKFLLTRNPQIAAILADKLESPQDVAKYQRALVTYTSHYENKKLPYLKINLKKTGFSVTVPKNPLDFLFPMKITPLFFITTFVQELTKVLQEKMVRVTFIKDDLYEREVVTTLNREILGKYYDEDFIQVMFSNVGTNLGRGYIKVPELGSSKYDATGTRSINLARITSVSLVETFDTRFINVDLSKVQPAFEHMISTCTRPEILAKVYRDLTGNPPQNTNIFVLKQHLTDEIQRIVAATSTTGLRDLHLYMIANPNIFVSYNSGVPINFLSMIDPALGAAHQPTGAFGVDAPIRTGGNPIKPPSDAPVPPMPATAAPNAAPMWGGVPRSLGGAAPTGQKPVNPYQAPKPAQAAPAASGAAPFVVPAAMAANAPVTPQNAQGAPSAPSAPSVSATPPFSLGAAPKSLGGATPTTTQDAAKAVSKLPPQFR